MPAPWLGQSRASFTSIPPLEQPPLPPPPLSAEDEEIKEVMVRPKFSAFSLRSKYSIGVLGETSVVSECLLIRGGGVSFSML